MKTWQTTDDLGNTYAIDAPDDVTEEEVNAFAAENAASWKNGGHYAMVAEGEATSDLKHMKSRNQLQDEAVAGLDKQIEKVTAELQSLVGPRTMNPGRAALLGGTGEYETLPTPDLKAAVSKKQAELKFLRAEREKRVIGNKGSMVGGMGGAALGGVVGGAIGNVPGALIGTIIGGALGSAAGTSLHDIPEARNARDISDEEAHQLIKDRAVESVIYDGAFILIFGPGGKLLGKIVKGQRFGPALKAAARESFAWQDIKQAKKAQTERVIASRAKDADSMASIASDKLHIPRRGTPDELNEDLLRTISKQSGGRVPTPGEVKGVVTGAMERLARSQSPATFAENDKILADTAQGIRDRALASLDRAGAVTGPDLGEAIKVVRDSAEATLKDTTGPIFRKAAEQRVAANMSGTLKYLDDTLAEVTEAAGANIKPSELVYLKRLRKALSERPLMPMRGAQHMVSGLKNMQRGLGSEGAPSEYFGKVMSELIGHADGAYIKALGEASDPALRKELMKARELYKATMGDLYSDTMARMAVKTPEDMGQVLMQKGTVTEIRDLRAALLRAEKNALKKPRMKANLRPDQAPQVVQMSREQMYQKRLQIDAGLIKGFLEKNTQSLTSLEKRLDDPEFARTLKELLVGEGAANPALGKKVLGELDKTLGVLKLIKPEMAPQAGRIGPAGVGAVGAGTAGAVITGSLGTGVALVVVVGGTLRMLGKATATALTHGDKGVLRAAQRVIRLIPAIHKLGGQYGVAGEAFRSAVYELDTWDRQTGGPGILPQPEGQPQ